MPRKLFRLLVLVGLCFAPLPVFAAGAYDVVQSLRSPDRKIEVRFTLDPFQYAVKMSGQSVIENSPLGLELKGVAKVNSYKVTSREHRVVSRVWQPVWGKTSQIADHYQELTLHLQAAALGQPRLDLVARAYNDGIVFRYVLPRGGSTQFTVTRELTSFRLPKGSVAWAGIAAKYHTAFEEQYLKQPVEAIPAGAHVMLPLLTEVRPAVFAAIAEADLTDWAGMFLTPSDASVLRADLSPRLDGAGLVTGTLPHASPWRVIMIGRSAGDLIQSNLIENLNPPSVLKDPSWIRPGMTAWDHWWSGDVRMDNETNYRFIRFASEMGFAYQLIDWQWYGKYNTPDADVTRPAAQLDMPAILKFAADHHVREWLWMHSGDVDRAKKANKLDAAFATFEHWGIAGVKIDFMDSNDQEMVNWYTDVVALAARHHLMVDYHGAYEPTGLRITYPNLLTREGVFGNEQNRFNNKLTPAHKLTLPFTRMLTGPMDYTPGGFINRSSSEWKKAQPTEVMGSRAQELALFVVYWSPLTCVADDPENYKGQPGLEFLRNLPTVWDDTRVLDGAVGEHIVVTRRSGKRWFIGGMTADQPYDYTLKLSFLPKGKYVAHIFRDPRNTSASYESVDVETQAVDAASNLQMHMRTAGGFAMSIEPASESTSASARIAQ